MKDFEPTPDTTLKRLPERGSFDRAIVNSILDEGFVCHVGFSIEGRPFVIPTSYVRVDDMLFVHGSAASRMLRSLSEGISVCVTVTLIDGLVLARSAFHHSINYRSVVILGVATALTNSDHKLAALKAFTEHVVPSRWAHVRQPNEQELKATTVLCLPLAEVSAKIRTGGPKDDEEDYAIPVWAGELPLRLVPGTPLADSKARTQHPVPDYVLSYNRRTRK